MKPIALLTATRWEFRAVCRALHGAPVDRLRGRRRARGRRGPISAQVVQTGIGGEAARRTAEQVLSAERFSAVVSIGFAGALAAAEIGELLIATEVLEVARAGDHASSCWPCSAVLGRIAAASAERASLPARAGRLLTVSAVIVSARRKAELGEATGAVGVDMESAAVGAAAAARAVPFLAVRAVSDRVDEDLPPSFNDVLVPGQWGRGMWSLVTSPADWAALNRMRRQSRVAGARLSAFVAAFLDAQD